MIHEAEPYRRGYGDAVVFGWHCLTCNTETEGMTQEEAERAAEEHRAMKSCKCSPFPGFVFRPALSSPADDPVLVRVCVDCDLPVLGHGRVVTSKGWQVFQRKANGIYRTIRRGRRIHS